MPGRFWRFPNPAVVGPKEVSHQLIGSLWLAIFCGAFNVNDKVLAFKYKFNWRDNTDSQIYLNWEMEQLSVDSAKILLEMWASHQDVVTYDTAIKWEGWVSSDGFKVFEPDWDSGVAKEREED